MPQLLDMPEELLELALSRLSFRDLISLTATNRALRTFILSTSIRLQYQFYLECFAVQEQLPAGPGPDPPTARQLELLIERERRWLNLAPAQTAMLRWPGDMEAHVVPGGLVCTSGFDSQEQSSWNEEKFDEDYGVKLVTTRVAAVATPGPQRELQRRLEWAECTLTFHLAAMCVSEEEDLIIVLEHLPDLTNEVLVAQLRFLSLSTGLPHPSGAQATIILEECTLSPEFWDRTPLGRTSSMQRAGSTLAVIVFWYETPGNEVLRLHVLDWPSGRDIIRPMECNVPVLAFLRPDVLLIAHASEASSCLKVVLIPPLEAEPVAVKPVANLEFPLFDGDVAMETEFCFCRPTASLDRAARFPSRDDDAELRFLPRHRDSLLFITYRVDLYTGGIMFEHTLIVRVDKLLAVLAATPSTAVFTPDAWLPQCARWIDPAPFLPPDDVPLCAYTWHLQHLADSGQRVAGFQNPENFMGPVPLLVIDANPWTVELVQRAARASTAMYSGPSIGPDPPIWRRLGILPGIEADGTLRTESGAVLRLVLPSDPVTVVTQDAFNTFADPPTQSALAYVEITAPAAAGYDCQFLYMNNESIIISGPEDDPETALVLYFG
ncbi:hypothetical protein MIND_00385000 [Mycena indigotica]|uniref:F-box domain-containing protein n=1 Tax=Mycena indigotica TaxID=2126181 RepID=A0A8H6T312_9AGAR|nr:uncharacterized protein MIND_00385000 [Mycena indigotica]KAF7310116.1 hypothetical protein MIND_00385000 [Mycena indigotica]